jgi:hypothetical protein
MPITPDLLGPVANGDAVTGRVEMHRSLEDALAAILLTDDGVVGVVDGTRLVGTLTAESVYRALRASLTRPRDAASPDPEAAPGG